MYVSYQQGGGGGVRVYWKFLVAKTQQLNVTNNTNHELKSSVSERIEINKRSIIL